MKCLILAAGYATRLYPLTEHFPKPLLPVQGKPILNHLIDDVERSGAIDEYVVISNAKFALQFESWAKTREKITVLNDGTVTNETRLGAVRDIAFAIDALSLDQDLLVIAGDNLLDFSLTRFLTYAAEKKTPCVMRYFEPSVEHLRKSGVLTIGPDDRILRMEEKPAEPRSAWCCPPFYFYTRATVPLVERAIEEGCDVDAPGSFIAWLSGKMTVHAMEMPGKRYDIGTLESYEQVKKEYKGLC